MKKLMLMIIAVVMLFAGSAYAENLSLGGKNVNYDIPAGYVKAEDPMYDVILGIMQKAMPQGLRIKAMYVQTANDVDFRTSNGESGLDNYLIITVLDQLANTTVSDKDFKDFKRELKENNGLLDEAKDMVSDKLDEVFDGQIQIGNMQSLGCFGETDNELSYVVLMDQQANVNGKQIAIRQALVFTGVLVDGKLIFINQYRIVDNESEVTAFKDHTQEVIKSMNFGGKAASVSANTTDTDNARNTNTVDSPAKQKSGMGMVVGIIIVVVVVVVIAGVVMQKRKGGNN